jgi:DNA-binding transcriptional LysR family regulator
MVTVPVDPGQLLALNALLEETSVTRAARRLGITQSSMSHRLAQLRQAFGDPLFVRVGAALVPTPRAAAMAQPLAEALRALAASVSQPDAPFDPAKARFSLAIAMPDLLTAVAPRLVSALTSEAPSIEVRLGNIVPALSRLLASDPPGLALTPTRFVDDDIRARPLGELSFAVAGRRGHPALRRELTTKSWLAHPHVVVRIDNEPTNLIEQELARRGLVRRVSFHAPSFLAGLLVVARSDFLMNVPVPIVHDAAAALGLTLRGAPIDLPNVPFALAWHPRFHHDPAHRWARERVLTALEPTFGERRARRRRAG